MFFGENFQTLFDAVFALIYNAVVVQFGAFFTLLELFQTLTGGNF